MRFPHSYVLATLTTTLLAIFPLASAQTPGTLTQIPSFGANPTRATLHVYQPRRLSTPLTLLTAVHHCAGTGTGFAGSTPYRGLADKLGFVVLYPGSPHQGGCWDVSSPATLRYDGGGDSNAIANMMRWGMGKWRVGRERSFVVGVSSGAMMTNVLAATYPDLFTAGTVYSGVPAGCFATTQSGKAAINAWNSTCARGQSTASVGTWTSRAKAMRPGYTGPRPKLQFYHGSKDDVLLPQNYKEEIKQWSGVLGYNAERPVSVRKDSPERGYTTSRYGPLLEGIFAEGVGHNVPVKGERDMAWFGIK